MILEQISAARLFERCLSALEARHGQSPRTPTGILLLRRAYSCFISNFMRYFLSSTEYLRRRILRQRYTVQTAVPPGCMMSPGGQFTLVVRQNFLVFATIALLKPLHGFPHPWLMWKGFFRHATKDERQKLFTQLDDGS
jgi:hypothetical protein